MSPPPPARGATTASVPWTPSPAARVERPPLVRPREGRRLGGVAVGLAAHVGVEVRTVRVVLVLSTIAGGFGAVLYAWLWGFVPVERTSGAVPPVAGPLPLAGGAPVAPRQAWPGPEPEERGRRFMPSNTTLGVLLVVAGIGLLGARLGWSVGPVPLLPVMIVVGGALLAYLQLDERSRWTARGVVGTRAAALRVLAGLTLVIVGALLAVVQNLGLAEIGRTLTAVVVVIVGALLVLTPWAVRLWRDLDAERAARARESERADIAAHLHDSVLQTLALIQRGSHDPNEVTRLARAQERDLRGWLYGGVDADQSQLAARVTAVAAEVEDVYGVVVDVVTVGDRSVDPAVAALLAALREAMVNAVRHGVPEGGRAEGPAVRVYVESGPDGVEAFVRDRGAGFDLAAVPVDRLGVRESILGRMRRHGGSAEVVSAPGEGTEVRLRLPQTQEENP